MKKLIRLRKKNQKGYTLLEYCAGAAVIAGVVYAALFALGNNFNQYLTSLSNFVARRTAQVNASDAGAGNTGAGNSGNSSGDSGS